MQKRSLEGAEAKAWRGGGVFPITGASLSSTSLPPPSSHSRRAPQNVSQLSLPLNHHHRTLKSSDTNQPQGCSASPGLAFMTLISRRAPTAHPRTWTIGEPSGSPAYMPTSPYTAGAPEKGKKTLMAEPGEDRAHHLKSTVLHQGFIWGLFIYWDADGKGNQPQ